MDPTTLEPAETMEEAPSSISMPATPGGSPPPGWDSSKTNSGTLNVARARHIVNKLTADPSWLIDPATAHAASAVFGAATKVIGMQLDIERATNTSDARKSQNEFTKLKIRGLNSLSGLVPGNDVEGQRELGRLNRMASSMSSPDFDLEDFSAGISAMESKYAAKSDSNDYAVKEFEGHRFLTGSGFKPIPLNSLTPENKIEAQVAMETLRSLRKMTEDATDPTEKKNLIQRQQNVLSTLREITGGGSPSTVPATNAPTASTDKIRVTKPDGTTGQIPASQKDAALQQGFKLIP